MKGYPGVTTATRKDGTLYYRSSITISNRHISLGSFDRLEKASAAYQTACSIMRDHQYHIPDYSPSLALDFSKFIILVNYRDNGLYFKTPIYLHKYYFSMPHIRFNPVVVTILCVIMAANTASCRAMVFTTIQKKGSTMYL